MSLRVVGPDTFPIEKLIKPSRDTCLFMDTEKRSEDPSVFTIYFQNEPEAIYPSEQYLLENGDKYDAILTYHDSVLQKWNHAVFLHFYTQTWIEEEEYLTIDPKVKQFCVSFVAGAKQITGGHTFRLQLYFNQQHFPENFVFFRSGAGPILPEIRTNPVLGKDCKEKIVLFKHFQFSIVIENSKQRHYFTEKLMDCLITKTIPIYYGCPNIDEYFDTKGWILLDAPSVEDLYLKVNHLHADYYVQHLDTVEANYKKCFLYKDMWGKMNKALLTIPGYRS
jgi:hypothetical protein